jgi:hypothetical protein
MKTKLFVFYVLTVFLIAGCSKVKTGEKIVCENCGKEIASTVQEISVPFWKIDKYKISIKKDLCVKCGNEKATTYKHILCIECGKEYKKDTVVSLRKERINDISLKKGFCPTCTNTSLVIQPVLTCRECGNRIYSYENTLKIRTTLGKAYEAWPFLKQQDLKKINAKFGGGPLGLSYSKMTIDKKPGNICYKLYGKSICPDCKRAVRREKKLRKFGDKAGGSIGSAVRGLLDGIKRHRQ